MCLPLREARAEPGTDAAYTRIRRRTPSSCSILCCRAGPTSYYYMPFDLECFLILYMYRRFSTAQMQCDTVFGGTHGPLEKSIITVGSVGRPSSMIKN